MRHKHHSKAFTLVELIVVVTIIITLLSILAPTLKNAVRYAGLAKCASNERQMGVGALNYAHDYRGAYPRRQRFSGNDKQMSIAESEWDWRPALVGYIDLDLFIDPLAGIVDYSTTKSGVIRSAYGTWFGWRYGQGGYHNVGSRSGDAVGPGSHESQGMYRIGDKVTFSDPSGIYSDHATGAAQGVVRVPILVSDFELISPRDSLFHTAHEDQYALARLVAAQDVGVTIGGSGVIVTTSWWQWFGTHERGPSTLNFLYDDLSVRQMQNSTHNDPRYYKLPEASSTHGTSGTEASPNARWVVLPKNSY